MYRHILIPTDGSELAEHAVTNGLSLAKSVGAKVTVIIVEEPFNWQSVSEAQAQWALEELAKHTEQIKKHAASVLNCAADAAKQAGAPCDTIQAKDAYPYQAIIATAGDRGCDLIVMASHGRSGLSAIVLGSVTNKVLTHTKTPVLVCHDCAGRSLGGTLLPTLQARFLLRSQPHSSRPRVSAVPVDPRNTKAAFDLFTSLTLHTDACIRMPLQKMTKGHE